MPFAETIVNVGAGAWGYSQVTLPKNSRLLSHSWYYLDVAGAEFGLLLKGHLTAVPTNPIIISSYVERQFTAAAFAGMVRTISLNHLIHDGKITFFVYDSIAESIRNTVYYEVEL